MTYSRRSFSFINIIRSVFLILALVGGNLLTPTTAHAAATYYVSATDGNDSNAGTSTTAPWKTLDKVNSFLASTSHVAGDTILFKRGDTFYKGVNAGGIIPKKSGTSSARITFSAYGTGNKPVISGFTPITSGWTSVGSNLWEITAPANVTHTSTLLMNNQIVPLGRYPKATAANGGYMAMTYNSSTGNNITLTDSTGSVTGFGNLAGAEVVTRPNNWTQSRGPILSSSGNTITLTQKITGNYNLSNGLGFFIQNHPNILTQNGEWAYIASTGKIRMYYVGTPPTAYFSNVDKLVDLTTFDYVTISNLSLEGAKTNAIDGNSAISIRVDGNDIKYAGQRAVYLTYGSDTFVTNNTITDSQNSGITVTSGSTLANATITDNTILNTGIRMGTVLPLVGTDRNQIALEISMPAGTNLVQYNTIRNVGNNGIRFGGNNLTIKNNVISNFNLQLDDGAGIYSYGGGNSPANPGVTQNSGRVITENIIYGGIGNPSGTSSGQHYSSGLYMDNNVNHVDITDNTVFDTSNKGIPINSPQYIKVSGNTFFNTPYGGIGICRHINDGSSSNGGQDPVGNIYTNNVTFATSKDHDMLYVCDRGVKEANPTTPDAAKSTASMMTAPNETLATRMRVLATPDTSNTVNFGNNIYRSLHLAAFQVLARDTTNSPWVNSLPRSLATWQKLTGREVGSVMVQQKNYVVNSTIATVYNNTLDTLTGITVQDASCNYPASNSNCGSASSAIDATGRVNGTNSYKMTLLTAPTGNAYTYALHTISSSLTTPVTAGKKYLVKFSTVGTKEEGYIEVALGSTAPSQFVSFGVDKADHELLFVPTSSTGTTKGALQLKLYKSSGDIYIDNIQVYEVDANVFDPNANVVFEYNETKTARTVTLPAGTYFNIRDTALTTPITGSVTIQPFRSVILIKQVAGGDVVAPVVTLTAPSAGAVLIGPATLTATASDNIGVSKVDFYQGNTLISSDVTSPYSAVWDTTTATNGTYLLKAVASDMAGNTASSSTTSVTVTNVVADVIAPTISLTSPTAGSTLTSTTTLSANASDNIGVTAVDFYHGTTLIGTDTSAPYSALWNVGSMANGAYVLKATARDAAGNTATSSTVSVTVNNPDITAPAVSLTSPTGGSVSNTVTISATASDNIAVASVSFFQGTTLIATDTTAPYSTTWNTLSLPNGTYALKAIASDTAGNQTSSSTVSVIISNADTTAPVVTLTAPSANAVLTGPATLTATASDNIAVASVSFFQGTTLIATDTTAPYSTTWNTLSLPNGTYALKAIASDSSNNTGTSSTVSVTVNNPDITAPTVSITSPTAGSTLNGSVTVSASATDNIAVSKVDFYQGNTLIGSDTSAPYSTSLNTTALSNGAYVLKAIATDSSNNTGTSSTVSVTVNNPDITAPTVSITSPTAGSTLNGSVTIFASASDNVGVAKVDIYVGTTLMVSDTTAPYSVVWNTLNSINGNFVLKAIAYDTAGNSTSAPTVTVTVNNRDTTLPTISLTSPTAGSTLTSTTTLSANASDNIGVTAVDFYHGTTLIGTDTSAPYSALWNVGSMANGAYVLKATARDAAGNTATSSTVSVTVNNPDITAPAVSLTSPTGGSVSNTVTISATASDNIAVASVSFFQGTTLIATDTTAPYSTTWNTLSLPNGTYALKAIASDSSNNTGTSSTVSVTVNNMTETRSVAITSPSNGSTISGTVAFNATTTGSGITSVDFYKNNDATPFATTSSLHTTFFDTKTISNGVHTFRAIANTNSGSITSPVVSLTISNVVSGGGGGGGGGSTITTPSVPTNVIAIPGYTRAKVRWFAPQSNGGAAINTYVIKSTPGGYTTTSKTSPAIIGGLANGTPYTFTVQAVNSAGTGAPALTNSATPSATLSVGTQVLVNVSSTLTVRRSASSTSQKVGSVANGSVGTVLESTTGWARVQFPSVTGWVSSLYIFPNL